MRLTSIRMWATTSLLLSSFVQGSAQAAAPDVPTGVKVGDERDIGLPNLGDLLVHMVPPISKSPILPATYPLPGDKSTILNISAARGEFEPGSFVLRSSSRDMSGLTVTASDLYGLNGGEVIPSENVDIKIVKPWFQSYYAWNEIGKVAPTDFRQKLVPELLLKDDSLVTIDIGAERNLIKLDKGNTTATEWVNQRSINSDQILPKAHVFPVRDTDTLQPFSLSRQSTKQLWVTVFVPRGTTPSEYEGDLVLRANGVLQGTIKLRVKVHNFELAQSKLTHSIYYRARLDDGKAGVGSEFRTMEQMKAELKNLLNHGVENPSMYQSYADIGLFVKCLQLRQELGMNNGPLFYFGMPTTNAFWGGELGAANNVLKRIFPQINALARAHGFSAVYLYGKDEARGAELVAQRGFWDLLHAIGGNVMVAGYTGSFELVGDKLDVLIHAYQPTVSEAQKWHNAGHKIFSYANPQTGPENPYPFRLNYGLLLWASNYDGSMPYAYQHCFGSCWNDIDHPSYRDHNLTYPTVDGVIDTLAWEGYREGVDDVRYVTTLENLTSSGARSASATADQARAFLNSLRSTILAKQGRAGKYNLRMDLDLDEVRKQIVDHIESLSD